MLNFKRLYLSILISFPLIVLAQEPIGLTFGGQKEDIGYDILQCSDGGYILCGSTKSFGNGNLDIYVLKLNGLGHVEWMKTYGWEHDDLVRSVVEINGDFLILGDAWDFGYSRLDMYLIKIDAMGNKLWDKQYGTNSKDTGYDILVLDDGTIALLGYSRKADPAGDIFIVKVDNEGNEIWRNNYGTTYDDYGIEIIQNTEGNLLIIGTEGGFYDDVYSTYFNRHDADISLLCIDTDGNELWNKVYGGEGHDFGYSVLQDDDGIYICGSTQSEGNGSFDMTLIKTDISGNKEWSKTYGGSEYEYGISMAENTEQDLYIFGTTKSFGKNHSADYYLLKTDKHGTEIWNLTVGGDLIDIGFKVCATADSGAIVIGKSNSFGNGYFDVFVVKVDKNGIIQNIINGIDSIYISDVQVYPNPIVDRGRFRYLSAVEIPQFYVEIISVSGQSISSFNVIAPNYNFNLEDIRSGFYFYRIRNKKDSKILFTGKLVVN
jgi:hypothetical protein